MRVYINKDKKNYEMQFHSAAMGLLAELPNLVLTIISALTANTLLIWSDTLASLGTTSHYSIVLLVARKMKTETGERT